MTWPNSKCNSWLDPASEVHSGFVLWWLDRFTFLQDINIDAVVEHSAVILQSLKYKTEEQDVEKEFPALNVYKMQILH